MKFLFGKEKARETSMHAQRGKMAEGNARGCVGERHIHREREREKKKKRERGGGEILQEIEKDNE